MPRSSSCIFPYQAKLHSNGKIETFPTAELTVKKNNKVRASLFCVIDSGATISVVPKTDAELFGKKAEDGMPFAASGISGVARGWQHTVRAYLNNTPLTFPLVFLDDEYAPRVLGREGVFPKFTIVFEEAKRRSAFLSKTKKETRAVGTILDSLAP